MFSVMVSLMADVYGPDAIFYSILLLSAALGFSQAKLCALLSPDSQTAFIYFALLISLEMILSGFLIFPEDAPVYLKWTMDIMFSRWAVSGLLFNQFNNFKENGDIANGILSNQGELVLNLYGLSSYDIWKSIWILCVYLVGLEVLVIISVMPKINRLKLMTSLSDSSRLWNIEEEAVVASGTSQSLQIDLISNSNRDRDTLSSKSFFDRFSIAEAVGQVTPNLVEPYNRMTASSSQHDSQLLTSEGRLAPRLTHTEPRDSCRVSDVLEPYQRADLVFRNVSYTIKNKTEEVQLLRGVSGVVKSGELCAIMGSSGAGVFTNLCPLLSLSSHLLLSREDNPSQCSLRKT
jgi:ABC-type multidrug transport system fused ATPase/permease subunit